GSRGPGGGGAGSKPGGGARVDRFTRSDRPDGDRRGDRRGDRVPVLGPRVERGRRVVVGRRRCRARDHLRDCRGVAVKTEAIGKTYPAVDYAVGREKVREYAWAVGETNPVYVDVDAARAAGYADVAAPPMFAVVYAGRAISPALFDPEVGINFANMLHAGQEFEWGPVVVAG